MVENSEYYVLRKKAVPEVLLSVVEAKRLVDTKRVSTIQEAVDKVGISRSSFYKYKDDIMEFHDNSKGMTLTINSQIDDEPGILSDFLRVVSSHGANILTIHQSIPINGTAALTLSIQILENTMDVSDMLDGMKALEGVRSVALIAKE